MPLAQTPSRRAPLVLASLLVAAVAACTTSQDPATRTNGINDPYEAQNRAIHEFNKDLDTGFVRPLSRGYAAILPSEARSLVNNFSENLTMPGVFVNSVLQGDVRGAGLATVRFAMNTTIGIGGLVDAASELGIAEHETDFGETLAVWGVGEGAYVELPLFGPSTQRDTAGLVVDFFTNPLTYATLDDSPERYVPPTSKALAGLDFRDRFADTINAVLYESADSYALSRQIYLQNRRFTIGDEPAAEIDPFVDPYEDPYAQ